MPITVTKLRNGISGNSRFTDFSVQFDSAYPAGGEAIAAADWVTIGGQGMTAAKCQLFQAEQDTLGNKITLDRTNDKFMLWAAAAQATGDQSAVTIRCRAWFDNQFG